MNAPGHDDVWNVLAELAFVHAQCAKRSEKTMKTRTAAVVWGWAGRSADERRGGGGGGEEGWGGRGGGGGAKEHGGGRWFDAGERGGGIGVIKQVVHWRFFLLFSLLVESTLAPVLVCAPHSGLL